MSPKKKRPSIENEIQELKWALAALTKRTVPIPAPELDPILARYRRLMERTEPGSHDQRRLRWLGRRFGMLTIVMLD